MDNIKIIVSHPGKQHSFQTATAMERTGILQYYVTSVYNKRGSITSLISKIAKGDLKKKLSTRFCSSISENKVKQINEIFVVITLFLNRFPLLNYFTENWNFFVESLFYKKLMKFVKKESPDAIIIYNGSSNKHLKELDNTRIVKIMDMSIAKREYIHDILQKEIDETGLKEIRKMHMSYWDEKMIRNDKEGCNMVDYFLVPSHFVELSLLSNGISREKIKLVPYGVDIKMFSYKERKRKDDILRIIYVGNISYRKGSHRLLQVVSEIDGVELFLAGAYDKNSSLYTNYSGIKNIHFMGFITRDKLNDLYNQCDIFILPSLCEGMAMVGLEAMATGLPLLCTYYSGVNDVIENGINGFVYNANKNDELKHHIIWFKNNMDKISEMSKCARETSLRYSWDIYQKNVSKAILECIKEKKILRS